MDKQKNPIVLFKTNKGDIKIELYPTKAPITVKNFLDYVTSGHYNNTIFHRVIDNFMIQGGGFDKDLKQKETKATIKNEADNSLKNIRGSIAMARTNVIDSATSQFFINVQDNDFLNFRGKSPSEYGYCVFGQVIDGMEVVDAIRKVRTGNRGMHGDVPTETIEILSSSVEE
jgi:peptidyl-prolyl cis-trans isomerase B (cyclophilin B)